MPVCKFFLQGRCYFGDSCRFRHVAAEEGSEAASMELAPAPSVESTKGGNNNNNSSSNAASTKNVREFDEFKAGAIHIAKRAQDLEPRPYDLLTGPFYSMDVECVAIGFGHSDKQRYPGRVSLVKDEVGEKNEVEAQEDVYEVLVDEVVNLKDKEVISYMTELTGLTPEKSLDPETTKPLDEIRQLVQKHLPSNATLVGHSIDHDIQWLGLKKGVDFKDSFDTSVIFRQRLPKNLCSAGDTVERIRAGDSNDLNAYPLDAVGSLLTSVGSSDTTHSNLSLKKKLEVDGSLDENLPFETRYRTFSLRHCCINIVWDLKRGVVCHKIQIPNNSILCTANGGQKHQHLYLLLKNIHSSKLTVNVHDLSTDSAKLIKQVKIGPSHSHSHGNHITFGMALHEAKQLIVVQYGKRMKISPLTKGQ